VKPENESENREKERRGGDGEKGRKGEKEEPI
jgi:hypothetical protein